MPAFLTRPQKCSTNRYQKGAVFQTFRGYTGTMQPEKILFVCMANIVRSPVAETLFRHALQNAGIHTNFVVDSAGAVPGFAGQLPHPIMTELAADIGITQDHVSRTLAPDDLAYFDLILVMDRENAADVRMQASTADHVEKIRYLRSFHPAALGDADIPDPIGGSRQDFITTFQLIRECINGLVESLYCTDHRQDAPP